MLCCFAGPVARGQLPEETQVDSTNFRGITYVGSEHSPNVGHSLAHAGDINADGKPDLLVGAAGAVGAPGRVFVLLGGRGGALLKRELPGPPEAAITLLTGSAIQDRFGAFVAGAGDVDQDGLDDFLIGAPAAGHPVFPNGAVFLVFGDPHFTEILDLFRDSTRAVLLTTFEFRGVLGQAGAGIGDVNADGFADFALGMPGGLTSQGGETARRTGKVIVVLGGEALRTGGHVVLLDRPEAPPTLEIPGFEVESELGFSVAPAGDFDRDGILDFAIGAPSLHGEGSTFVIFGRADPEGPIDLSMADGRTAVELRARLGSSRFGAAIAGGLDATGDGGADLLIGAPTLRRDGGAAGGAVLVPGGPRFRNVGLAEVPGQAGVLFRGGIDSQTGASVALVPDLNQSGVAEALMGAPNAAGGRGASYLVYDGTPPGSVLFLEQPERAKQVVFRIGAPQARLGSAVAGLPDRNGDALGNFALGAPGFPTRAFSSAGAVFEVGVPADLESLAPRDLKASLLSGDRVRLSWTIATIYRSLQVYRDGTSIGGLLPGHLQQFTDVAPGRGKHVYFVEANGERGLRSNLAEIEVRGLPVQDLLCHQVDALLRARASWVLRDRYESLAVNVDGVRIAVLTPEVTSFEFNTTPGEHLIEVYDPRGVPVSERARCRVVVVPTELLPIDGLTCVAEEPRGVRLNWQPSPTYAIYGLKRNGIPIGKVAGDVSTYLDVGVPTGPHRYEVFGWTREFHAGPSRVCETVVQATGGTVLRGRVAWTGDGPVRSGTVKVYDGVTGEGLGVSAQLNNLGRFEVTVQERSSYRLNYIGNLGAGVLDCAIAVPPERIDVSTQARSLDEDITIELPPPVLLVTASGAETPENGPAARWRLLRSELEGKAFHFALVLPAGIARGAHSLSRGIGEVRDYLRTELGSAPSSVDLVAYGAAGLSARAFLAGTAREPVRRLILLGTPNLGTVRGHLEAKAELAGKPIRLPGEDGADDCRVVTEPFVFSSAAEQTQEYLDEFNSKVTFLRGARTHLIAGNGGLHVLDPVLGCTSHDNRVCESSALGGVPGATLHTIPEDHEALGRGASSVALIREILSVQGGSGGGDDLEGDAPALGAGEGGADLSHPPGDVYSGVLEPGGQGNFPMISDTSESIIIILNTDQPGGIEFKVLTPSGKTIDPPAAGALQGIEYQTYGDGEGHILQAYKFEPCELGLYTAQLENPAGNQPLQYSVESYIESGLALSVLAEPDELDLPEEARLQARLTRNGQGQTGSTVEAQVWRPDGSLVIVPLLDDGQGSDQSAGDGIYTAAVTSGNQPGIHEVVISATASIGLTTLYRRQTTTRLQVRSDLIAFSGGFTASADDDDANEVLESIHVDFQVVSKASGIFLVTGKLFDPQGSVVAEGGTLFGLSGPQTAPVRIYFSGNDIYQAHRNGPFTLSDILLLDGTAGFVEADRRANALVTQAFSWSSFGVLPSGESYIRGDANEDARIDISDAVAILNYLFSGTKILSCLDAADSDASGGLNITDSILILDFLFAGKRQLPAPFPACGVSKILGCESFPACD